MAIWSEAFVVESTHVPPRPLCVSSVRTDATTPMYQLAAAPESSASAVVVFRMPSVPSMMR